MISGKPDEGRIFMKKKIQITDKTTIGSLFEDIFKIIPPMVLDFLDKMEAERIKPKKQNEFATILSYPRLPIDGWIDWSKSAIEIDRLVRSVSKPYPGAYTCWNFKKIIIWEGRILRNYPLFVGVPGHVIGSDDSSSIKVLTGKGIYVVEEIQTEEGQILPPASLIKGTQQRLGMISHGELFNMLKELIK